MADPQRPQRPPGRSRHQRYTASLTVADTVIALRSLQTTSTRLREHDLIDIGRRLSYPDQVTCDSWYGLALVHYGHALGGGR